MKKAILFLLLTISIACHAQVNVTGKSMRIMNSDSTHGEINNTEYVTSAGYYRYKENGVWYYRASTADIAAATASLTASNGLTKTGNVFRLGGTLTSNTIIADNGSGWNMEFGQNLTRLLNFRAYASGSVNLDGATSTNIQTGTQSLGLSTTASTLTGATLNLTSSTGNTNIAASGEINLDAVSDVDITSSGGSIDVISAGTFITTSTAETEIRGTSGVYLTSTSGPVAFNTNSTNRLIIDNDGSWTINGATGTSGQALISNGSTSTPTWQTLSATIGGTIASTQVGYGSGANTLTSEAAFNYDDTSNTLTVDNILSNSLATLSFTGLVDVDIQAIGDVLLQPNDDIILNTGDDILLTDALVNNNALTSLMGRNSSTGAIEERTVASITGAPAGSDTQVQFNNSGAFGADSDLTFTGGNTLNATNVTTSGATSTGTLSITQGAIVSGTYVPTFTIGTNVTSASQVGSDWGYIRVGNVVIVQGTVEIDAVAAGDTNTDFEVSLPIASNFTDLGDGTGAGVNSFQVAAVNTVAQMNSSNTSDRMSVTYHSPSTSGYQLYCNFTYKIK